ncbi:MAG TPA: ATP-binding cassette domain-containing protein, partial [Acidimicrobiales bacterium]|nr:ATP-binding cassette domain-containing protein [Acidimicrobiales bacterium]
MNAPGAQPLMELVGVSAERASGRGPLRVVDDLTLSVAAGELVALMGPSGSGKTSVLQVASGLLAPTAGIVRIDGETLHATDRSGWATVRRRTVGMIHQRLDLLAGLDVLDNVALPLLLDGTKLRRAHETALAALDRLGIAGLAKAAPDELSVGQQQLVAVARAIVGERRLVLADEPTAALDTVAAERVADVLADLAAAG